MQGLVVRAMDDPADEVQSSAFVSVGPEMLDGSDSRGRREAGPRPLPVVPEHRIQTSLLVFIVRLKLVGERAENPYVASQSIGQLDQCTPPSGNGRVLITSRNRDLEQIGPVLRIDVFDPDTAADYLTRRTGRHNERGPAVELAGALGGLPLALAHAGAYCAQGTTFADYQALLDGLPPRALYDRSREAFYRQTVATTWQTSISAAEHDAPLARPVLMMAAHLAADAIPLAPRDRSPAR